MARQDVVRALVPKDRLEDIVTGLRNELEVDPDELEVEPAEPGTYRDERPDLELRSLVRAGRTRVAIGVVIGAVIGVLIAAAVPPLREWAPLSFILLAFGGAWGTGAAVAARAVQVHRDEGDRPEVLHEVSPEEAADLRIVTVHSLRERSEISDHLADRGLVLLDSLHPRVGQERPGTRPADPDAGGAGPPEH